MTVVVCVLSVVGCGATDFPDHVSPSASLEEQADCLTRYAFHFKGYELESSDLGWREFDERGDNTGTCVPQMTVAREVAFVACFNKYNIEHGHQNWPLANLKACQR